MFQSKVTHFWLSVTTGTPGERYLRTPWLVLPQEDKRVTVSKETVVLCQWAVETNVWFINRVDKSVYIYETNRRKILAVSTQLKQLRKEILKAFLQAFVSQLLKLPTNYEDLSSI